MWKINFIVYWTVLLVLQFSYVVTQEAENSTPGEEKFFSPSEFFDRLNKETGGNLLNEEENEVLQTEVQSEPSTVIVTTTTRPLASSTTNPDLAYTYNEPSTWQKPVNTPTNNGENLQNFVKNEKNFLVDFIAKAFVKQDDGTFIESSSNDENESRNIGNSNNPPSYPPNNNANNSLNYPANDIPTYKPVIQSELSARAFNKQSDGSFAEASISADDNRSRLYNNWLRNRAINPSTNVGIDAEEESRRFRVGGLAVTVPKSANSPIDEFNREFRIVRPQPRQQPYEPPQQQYDPSQQQYGSPQQQYSPQYNYGNVPQGYNRGSYPSDYQTGYPTPFPTSQYPSSQTGPFSLTNPSIFPPNFPQNFNIPDMLQQRIPQPFNSGFPTSGGSHQSFSTGFRSFSSMGPDGQVRGQTISW